MKKIIGKRVNIVLFGMILIFLLDCSNKNQEEYKANEGRSVYLSDKNATDETRALYHNLKNLSGEKILFGHQDDLAYGVTWERIEGRSDVRDACGSYPAVFGWDISDIGKEINIDSVGFEDMRRWIIKVYEMGGVNTISWHAANPLNKSNSWDTTSVVKYMIPGGKLHESYKAKLDTVAMFFESLKTNAGKYVPIIFRPYHEHTGFWFWWGKTHCTTDEYKSLWRFTVQYLRDVKGLHHILYAYSPDIISNKEEYLERYPGDEWVDILGLDDYHDVGETDRTEDFVNRLTMLNEIAKEKNKVAALSETGKEMITVDDWWSGVLLKGLKANDITKRTSYVMVWRNDNPKHFYAPYPGHKSVEDFMRFKNDPYTILLDSLPDLYSVAN